MLKKRGAGVLLHISSMPSEYGVGVFDENVIHFIDKIADMGFTYWQVLPFNPLDGLKFTVLLTVRLCRQLPFHKSKRSF